mmetsp:Transcript_586/g.1221  ORF Transcript_586/g.1221 Transcript_586/m.1221 type:complete len:474 (+) Transcript_586:2370-3791(+)
MIWSSTPDDITCESIIIGKKESMASCWLLMRITRTVGWCSTTSPFSWRPSSPCDESPPSLLPPAPRLSSIWLRGSPPIIGVMRVTRMICDPPSLALISLCSSSPCSSSTCGRSEPVTRAALPSSSCRIPSSSPSRGCAPGAPRSFMLPEPPLLKRTTTRTRRGPPKCSIISSSPAAPEASSGAILICRIIASSSGSPLEDTCSCSPPPKICCISAWAAARSSSSSSSPPAPRFLPWRWNECCRWLPSISLSFSRLSCARNKNANSQTDTMRTQAMMRCCVVIVFIGVTDEGSQEPVFFLSSPLASSRRRRGSPGAISNREIFGERCCWWCAPAAWPAGRCGCCSTILSSCCVGIDYTRWRTKRWGDDFVSSEFTCFPRSTRAVTEAETQDTSLLQAPPAAPEMKASCRCRSTGARATPKNASKNMRPAHDETPLGVSIKSESHAYLIEITKLRSSSRQEYHASSVIHDHRENF